MARSRPRRITLTRRGWSLVGAATGLVAGSYLLGTVEMLVLGVSALVLLAGMALRLALGRPPRLTIDRRVKPDRLQVGADGRIDLRVENAGPSPSALVLATDWFDEGRRAARFIVPPLPPGAHARAAYRIPTRRRGRYRVGPLALSSTDAFGLARRTLDGIRDSEVLVRPRVHDIVPPVVVGRRAAGESDLPAPRPIVSDLGDEFLTLREYEVGDDLRRVHWRSTARTGDLMIRQHEARWRSRATVVLDVHPDGLDAESFEVAVEAAASVVSRLLRLQRRVELVTSTGELLGVGGDPRHDLIDRLATVSPHPTDRLAIVLENLAVHRRADLVVAVLGRVGSDVVSALRALVGISVVTVLTQPVAVPPTSALVVVDATAAPFRDAWNQVFTRTARLNPRTAAWQRAHAPSHRSPSPR